MDIKKEKVKAEKVINNALVNFNEITGLKVDEIQFSEDPKVGYRETKDYNVKIKASI